MKRKAILFVDIDESDIPIYQLREALFAVAREMGLACITTALAGRKNTARLHLNCDQLMFLHVLSVDTLLRACNELDDEYELQVITCYAGQVAPQGAVGRIVAEVCEKLGLAHASGTALDYCNNKFLMRQALEKAGVPSIRYAWVKEETDLLQQADTVGYPLIAKPPFGAGSAFTKRCVNESELLAHYRAYVDQHEKAVVAAGFYANEHVFDGLDGNRYQHVPGKVLLLEQCIEGLEGSVECVVQNGTVTPLLVQEKLLLTELGNTILENLLITPPVSWSVQQIASIKEYAVQCLVALGLNLGIAHLEFRMTAQGPLLIEVNPRLGGLYVSAAFTDIAGINPNQLMVEILLGQAGVDMQLKKAANRVAEFRDYYSMFALYPHRSGVFKGIEGLPFIQNCSEINRHEVCIPLNTHVESELEERYLAKFWAKIQQPTRAETLYREVMHHVRPIIE